MGGSELRFEPCKAWSRTGADPKPMSSQVKTSQLSTGLSATAAWKAATAGWKVTGCGRGGGPTTSLASLCAAKIYCKIQFPVFIAHFQQHLLSHRHQRLWENNFYCISLAIRKMNVRRENDGKGPAWQETNGDWRMSNVVGVSKYFFFFCFLLHLLPPLTLF